MLPAGNMYDDMYYVHNIHFLASACNMEGNAACALNAAKKLVDYITLAYARTNSRVVHAHPALDSGRFNRWDAILSSLSAPPNECSSLPPSGTTPAAPHTSHSSKPSQAATERKALAAVHPESPQRHHARLQQSREDRTRTRPHRPRRPHRRSPHPEHASQSLEAIALWKKAVATLDTFAYNEPADWYYPIRESLGGALLRNNQPVEAEAVFRRDLALNPGSGRSLFGLWQSLLMQKRTDDAAFVKTQFDAAWKHATITLTVDAL